MHVEGTIEVPNASTQGAAPNNRYKKVIFKNCGPLVKSNK